MEYISRKRYVSPLVAKRRKERAKYFTNGQLDFIKFSPNEVLNLIKENKVEKLNTKAKIIKEQVIMNLMSNNHKSRIADKLRAKSNFAKTNLNENSKEKLANIIIPKKTNTNIISRSRSIVIFSPTILKPIGIENITKNKSIILKPQYYL